MRCDYCHSQSYYCPLFSLPLFTPSLLLSFFYSFPSPFLLFYRTPSLPHPPHNYCSLSSSLFFYYEYCLQLFLALTHQRLLLWTCHKPLLLPRSTEFLAHNYCCESSPLILPHGCSEIFSLGFMFHLISYHICLAIFLNSRSGWLIGSPYNTPLLWLPHLLLHPFSRVHSPPRSSVPWSMISFPLSRWDSKLLSSQNYLVHGLIVSWVSPLSLLHQRFGNGSFHESLRRERKGN